MKQAMRQTVFGILTVLAVLSCKGNSAEAADTDDNEVVAPVNTDETGTESSVPTDTLVDTKSSNPQGNVKPNTTATDTDKPGTDQ